MADNAPTEETTEGEEKPKGKMGGMIKIGGFVAVVIAIECLLAFFFIPTGSDVNAMVEQEYGTSDAVDPLAELTVDENLEKAVEVDLGEYSVAAYQPLSNTTLRIDFHLFGVISEEELPEFEERYGKIENRFKDKVNMTVRSSEINDLTDASLSLIRRKLQEHANRTLGKPLVRQVVFSEFSFVEQ